MPRSHIDRIPDELTAAIQQNKCALYVGAGMSAGATLPDWPTLMTNLISHAKRQRKLTSTGERELLGLLGKHKYLVVAQHLSDALSETDFRSALIDEIQKVGASPTKAHLELPRIRFPFVITTNYDDLIETAYTSVNKKIPTTYRNNDVTDFADALWRGDFFILKAHGDVSHRVSMVITEADYRKSIFSSPGYIALLSAIFTTKTVLFIGVSMDDPETKLLLSSLHNSFQGSGVYHYALVEDGKFTGVETSHWEREFKVRFIKYTATTEHPEVVKFLKKLPRI